MKKKIIIVALAICVTSSVYSLADEVKLSTIMPRSPVLDVLRAKKGAVGTNFCSSSYLPDGNIPESSLMVESILQVGGGETGIPKGKMYIGQNRFGETALNFTADGSTGLTFNAEGSGPIHFNGSNIYLESVLNIAPWLNPELYRTNFLSMTTALRAGSGTSCEIRTNSPSANDILVITTGMNNNTPWTGTIYLKCGELWSPVPIQPSDISLKTDISTIPNALERVCMMRGVDFKWKDGSDEVNMGLIGQEVERIFPEVVRTNDQGKKCIQYSALVGALVEAIKEQQKKIDSLESRLSALEAKK